MLGTADLHRLIAARRQQHWRLVLVGDPHQLQAVGRGGMFAELCATGRTDRARTHPPLHQPVGSRRVTAAATRRHPSARRLRSPRPDRRPARFDEHLDTIADHWSSCRDHGRSTGDHDHHERARRHDQRPHPRRTLRARRTRPNPPAPTSPTASYAYVGDLIATRRNDRTLVTSTRPVRPQPRPVDRDRHRRHGDLTVDPHRRTEAPSCSPPSTSATTSASATPPPNPATSPTPKTAASPSPPRRRPAAACTSA